MKTTNDTGEERKVDLLYLGPADNGCGHVVFKSQTKQPISLPRVALIIITNNIINKVNQIGIYEGDQKGIICTDMFGNVMLDDFDFSNYSDDDCSNASDKSYEFIDEEF